ncbi:hypothetical protein [Methanolacinia petrolearia]|uniref:hypothetical protein n=1 Tax=Methanolacinia petrolearia TaxID=54120 RepID=UPI003BAC2F99
MPKQDICREAAKPVKKYCNSGYGEMEHKKDQDKVNRDKILRHEEPRHRDDMIIEKPDKKTEYKKRHDIYKEMIWNRWIVGIICKEHRQGGRI